MISDEEYDRLYEEASRRLLPSLTREFLSTLLAAAVLLGGACDSVEVACFVRECFHLAGEGESEDLEERIGEGVLYDVAHDEARVL